MFFLQKGYIIPFLLPLVTRKHCGFLAKLHSWHNTRRTDTYFPVFAKIRPHISGRFPS